nr:MAG TPA: Lower collar protein [Caudoviricetes sp.]
MSKYTIEINQLVNDLDFILFDFEYNLYDNELKSAFEKKFIDHFYFYEIGLTPIARFKKALQIKLNDIYPYFKQLYQTELRCNDIDFMLNKDLKEQYTRELTGNSSVNQSSTSSSNDTSLNINNDTPQNKIDDLDQFMTSASKNTDNSTMNSSGTNSAENNSTETYSLVSQGNIGVTSSAELLEKWRNVLINIDQMIFEECNDLFMLIY